MRLVTSRSRLFWVVLTAFLFGSMPLLFFRAHPDLIVNYQLDADTFYYLTVAAKSQGKQFFTFDGVYPTNGFHPVWQWTLYWLFKTGLLRLSAPQMFLRLFEFNLAIMTMAIAGMASVIVSRLRHAWLCVPALVPGFVWMLFAPVSPRFLSMWSFVNGMETAVSLLFLSAAILCYGRTFQPGWRLWLGHLLLGVAVLCRLDDVFYLLTCLALGYFANFRRSTRLSVFAPMALPLALLAAYLAYNRISVGVYMPISGAAKSGFGLIENAKAILNAFPGRSWSLPKLHPHEIDTDYAETFERLFQMFFPILISLLYLWRKFRNLQDPVLSALCIGMLLKGLYNAVCVSFWHQGHWYYGSSIFVCNLVLALTIDGFLGTSSDRRARSGLTTGMRTAGLALGVSMAAVFEFNAVVYNTSLLDLQDGTRILAGKAALTDLIDRHGNGKFLEFDDGRLSFATMRQGESGFGLTSDIEGAKALKDGRYLDLLESRGISIAVSGPGLYTRNLDFLLENSRNSDVWAIKKSEFERYRMDLQECEPTSGACLYRIRRR